MKNNNLIYICLILFSGLSRLVPHPWNLTPILAACLFSGYKIKPIGLAIFIPIFAVFISDILLGIYNGISWVYISYIFIIGIGLFLSKFNSIQSKIISTISGTLIFFLISNFGVWISVELYPKSIDGLISCYLAGIPFYKNTLIGTVFYSSVFFTISELLEKRIIRLTSTNY